MLDELIRPADAHYRRVDLIAVQMLHHRATKTVVQDVIFDRADDFDAAREKFQRAGIERFDPARIDERDGETLLLQFLCRFFCNFEHVAESKDRDIATVLHDFGFADFEQFRFRFRFCARAGAARITHRDRSGVVIGHCPKHVDEFVFIFRLHVHDVWDMTQITDVEQTVVRRAVVAAQARRGPCKARRSDSAARCHE